MALQICVPYASIEPKTFDVYKYARSKGLGSLLLVVGTYVHNGEWELGKPFEILEEGEESVYEGVLYCPETGCYVEKVGEITTVGDDETYNDLLIRFAEEYEAANKDEL